MTSKDILKKIYRRYEKSCSQMGQSEVHSLKAELRKSILDDRLVNKIVVEPQLIHEQSNLDSDDDSGLKSSLHPFFDAIRQERYFHIQHIHVWRFQVNNEDANALAKMIGTGLFPLKQLEFISCQIDSIFISNIAKSLPYCPTLAFLTLDHNPICDEGCKKLWGGLKGTRCLKVLSLNYCSLTWISGSYLGALIAGTSIRTIHLSGNELLSIGALEVIHHCVKQVEFEMQKRNLQEIKMEEEKDRIRITQALSKHAKKLSLDQPPPFIGPWITELHLADNGLNTFIPLEIMGLVKGRLQKEEDLSSHYHDNALSECPFNGALKMSDLLLDNNLSRANKNELNVTSEKIFFMFMKKTAKLIAQSDSIEELDLANNEIGNLGGLIIKEALELRRKNDLPKIKLKITHKTLHEVVIAVSELGGGADNDKKLSSKKKERIASKNNK